MVPTGSWPMINPGFTAYSPLRMCRSVPQIVVSVTRMSASPGPGFGHRNVFNLDLIWTAKNERPHRGSCRFLLLLESFLKNRSHVYLPFDTVHNSGVRGKVCGRSTASERDGTLSSTHSRVGAYHRLTVWLI